MTHSLNNKINMYFLNQLFIKRRASKSLEKFYKDNISQNEIAVQKYVHKKAF